MTNLNHLTDEALHEETKKLFLQERMLLISIIHHLRENDRRRLYSLYKHDSLEDYLIFEFGCSEDQAWRRVDAISLLEDLPELEAKISEGLHFLTNLNLAHSLFKKEAEFAVDGPFTKGEKLDILDCIECMPTRRAKKILLGFSSVPHEMVKDKRQNLTMDELVNNDLIQEKLEKIRGLLAHSHPGISQLELINKICDLAISSLDPGKKSVRVKKWPVTSAAARDSKPNSVFDGDSVSNSPAINIANMAILSKAHKYRIVWQKGDSRCENCGSYFALQIEHKTPRALGGKDELDNLKLLCRSCNQRSAIEAFGLKKMSYFFSNTEK